MSACSDTPSEPDTQNVSRPSQPTVAWLRKAGSGVECVRTFLSDGKEKVLVSKDTLPVETVWDQLSGKIYFLTACGVFRKDLNADSNVEKLGGLTESAPVGSLYQGWITGGKLRIVFSIPEWDFTDELKQKFSELLEGKAPAGIGAQLLLIYELTENGTWKSVCELTSCMSEDPGDPLADIRQEILQDNGSTSTRSLILTSA